VDVRPSVLQDISQALKDRSAVGLVLLDLHNRLPQRLALYQSHRTPRNPGCFWYGRHFVVAGKIYRCRFVVRDTDPTKLEVIWVLITS
jgi:hypothetical protein